MRTFALGLLAAVAVAALASGQEIIHGGSPSVNGARVAPLAVSTAFVDAGVVSVSAPTGAECAIGITASASDWRGLCFNTKGGLAATAPYLGYTAGAVMVMQGPGNVQIGSGTGNTITLTTSGTGAVSISGSKSVGTCTLNAASPSTCTATVTAGAVCTCSPVGASAAIAAGGCAVSLSSTTLTVTGPNGASNAVNYHCF